MISKILKSKIINSKPILLLLFPKLRTRNLLWRTLIMNFLINILRWKTNPIPLSKRLTLLRNNYKTQLVNVVIKKRIYKLLKTKLNSSKLITNNLKIQLLSINKNAISLTLILRIIQLKLLNTMKQLLSYRKWILHMIQDSKHQPKKSKA